MNKKILEILEFKQITKLLEQEAITGPAKVKAQNLKPASDYEEVAEALDQTYVLTNILRIKGQLPLTDFQDIANTVKRLKVKANLNANELGNVLLILTLANDLSHFFNELEQVDLTVIKETISNLAVPELFFKELKKSLDFDGTVLDSASSDLARIRHDIKSNEEEIKTKMDAYLKGSSSKYLSEQIVTIRDERYVIPVKQEYRAKFGGVVHDQSASGQTFICRA